MNLYSSNFWPIVRRKNIENFRNSKKKISITQSFHAVADLCKSKSARCFYIINRLSIFCFYVIASVIMLYCNSQNVVEKKSTNFNDFEKNLTKSNIWKSLNNSIFAKNLYNLNFFPVCSTPSYRGSTVFCNFWQVNWILYTNNLL